MNHLPRWCRIVGLVIHILIGGLLIFSGSMKLIVPLPDELKSSGIVDFIKLIAVGEFLTGVLLIVPLTSSLGVLLASGFWGGTIVFHMLQTKPEDRIFVFQAVLLVLTWIAGYLR